jgi:hypothetical protein
MAQLHLSSLNYVIVVAQMACRTVLAASPFFPLFSDYHPAHFVPHYDHYDYVPGHYDVHYDGHWDDHHF